MNRKIIYLNLKFIVKIHFIILIGLVSNVLNAQIDSFNCPKALHLDGINDYIQCKPPFFGIKNMTIELWFNSNATPGRSCTNDSLTEFDWLFSFLGDKFGMGLCDGKLKLLYAPLNPIGNHIVTNFPEIEITQNKWHHVAVGWDTATGGKVFYNGNPVYTFGKSFYSISEFINIGRSAKPSGPWRNWEGYIDEFKIWNRLRSDEEIMNSFRCVYKGDESGLVTFYPFQQGVGSADNTQIKSIKDFSATRNDGIILNIAMQGNSSNIVCNNNLVLDSTCIQKDSCLCKEIEDLTISNEELQISILCNQRGFVNIPCSASEKYFNIKGMFNCNVTCKKEIIYEIKENSSNRFVKQGTPKLIGDHLLLDSLDFTLFTINELYIVSFKSTCGSTSCICNLQFKIICDNSCFNRALQFDGTGNQIHCLSPLKKNQAFSIDFLFKADSIYRDVCNLNTGSNFKWLFACKNNEFGMGICDNKLQLAYSGNNTKYPHFDPGFPNFFINTNERNHVIIVWDTATGGQIYLNGQYVYPLGKENIDAFDSIVIGSRFKVDSRDTFPEKESFNGIIDEFKLWNYKLSPLDIFNFAGCKTRSDAKGLITYYDFNQGLPASDNRSIKKVIDISNFKNHATISAFKLQNKTSNFICDSLFKLDTTCINKECKADFNFTISDCNQIRFNAIPSMVPSNESNTYLWTSNIGGLNSQSQNPSFQFLLSDTIIEVCLEVSNDLCKVKTCKNIKLNKLKPVTISPCPNDITYYSCQGFFRDSLFAFDSCRNIKVPINYIRSDGRSITLPFDLGTTQVTAIAKNLVGLESICQWNVIVKDTFPPECRIINPIVNLNMNGIGNFSTKELETAISDQCSPVEIEQKEWNFNCDNLGVSSIEITAKDKSNNSRKCIYNLKIKDVLVPECIGRDTILTAENDNGTYYSYSLLQFDNCGNYRLECSHPSGTLFPCGLTNASCTIIDSSGNRSRCHFTVDVRECKTCCKNYDAFLILLKEGIKVNAMFNQSGECIAVLRPPKLKGCQYISRVEWGDGTIMNGKFPDSLDFTHEFFGPGTYNICITIQEGNDTSCFNGKICTTFNLTTDCSSTLITEPNEEPKIIIYPNPFRDDIMVSSINLLKEIKVFDSNGKSVKPKWEFNSGIYKLSLSELPEGIFTMFIHDEKENKIIKRIIKIK